MSDLSSFFTSNLDLGPTDFFDETHAIKIINVIFPILLQSAFRYLFYKLERFHNLLKLR